MGRIGIYSSLSKELAGLNDEELASLIAGGHFLGSGIGGNSKRLQFKDQSLFVKQIPLTDLERQPQNIQSTANLFELPTFCQYGLGGHPGFGAWREVAAHTMATKWVINGECENFPILYHWRVLPRPKPGPMNQEQLNTLEQDVKFWENSAAVKNRIESVHSASAELVLFMEYFPQNLLRWLSQEFAKGGSAAEAAVDILETHLGSTIEFMNSRGLFHFDTHFENILTDGRRLYLGDFGLAISEDFSLSGVEIDFLQSHSGYDHGRSSVGLVHAISSSFLGKVGDWKHNWSEYLRTNEPPLPSSVDAILKAYSPTALKFLEFSRLLLERSKLSPYPAKKLGELTASIRSRYQKS
jgi:hypothetical protein